MLNVEKYFDIPYVWNGRGFDGCDCYGLVILFLKAEFGVNVMDYHHNMTSDRELTNSTFMLEHACDQWIAVPFEQAQPGDVLLICNNSELPNHCGVVVGDRRFLHAVDGIGGVTSKLSTWNRPSGKRRIHSVYRHKEML